MIRLTTLTRGKRGAGSPPPFAPLLLRRRRRRRTTTGRTSSRSRRIVQLAADGGEDGGQRTTQLGESADRGHRHESGDQAVLERGRTGLVLVELPKHLEHLCPPPLSDDHDCERRELIRS